MAEIVYPSAESVRSEEISGETRLHLAHAVGALLQQLPATAPVENADLADAVGVVLAFLPPAMRAHAVARASFEAGDTAWQQLGPVITGPDRWWVDDGQGAFCVLAPTAAEAAEVFVNSGNWPAHDKTTWHHVRVWPLGKDRGSDHAEDHTVTLHPVEPACSCGPHVWCAPHEVVGGLKENPGVQGHGGGVVIREVCQHCGVYRITDTWAQDPATGEQGLESIRYEEADEASEAWVASLLPDED